MVRVLALYQNGEFALNRTRSALSSFLEKKLAIALKTLLILEAAVKAVFIVKANLIQERESHDLIENTSIFIVVSSGCGSSCCKLHNMRSC